MLKDAETGEVIAEDGTTIGIATNNVAEYSGLIAGLKLAEEFAPDADIEVRMDSKLVVEQMSGRWKIKHPDMRPLAMEANRLAPFGTTYTWVPREQNKHADRLANEALDGKRSGVTAAGAALGGRARHGSRSPRRPRTAGAQAAARGWGPPAARRPRWSWSGTASPRTPRPRSSPAAWRAPTPGSATRAATRSGPPPTGWPRSPRAIDAVVSSPVRRTMESAEIIADVLGQDRRRRARVRRDGVRPWDGLTFAEVAEQDKAGLDGWLGSLETAAAGRRVVPRRSRSGCWPGSTGSSSEHPARTVVVVSHVTPIKTLVAQALDAPLEAVFRMELSPASVTVLSFFPEVDGKPPGRRMRLYNARPPGDDAFSAGRLVVPALPCVVSRRAQPALLNRRWCRPLGRACAACPRAWRPRGRSGSRGPRRPGRPERLR